MTINPMHTAQSAMSAYATGLSMHASNTANTQTPTSKRVVPSFGSTVTGGTSGTGTAISVKTNKLISESGLLQATSSATDCGVAGTGFFIVKKDLDSDQVYFTRKGDFIRNEKGHLKNSSGEILMAWSTDRSGKPFASNLTNVSSLTPVNVNTINGIATATESCTFKINLDATALKDTQHTTAVTFYDNLGQGHDIKFTWTRQDPADQLIWKLDVSANDGSIITKETDAGAAYTGLMVKFNENGTVNNWDQGTLNVGDPLPKIFIKWSGASGSTSKAIVPHIGTSGDSNNNKLDGAQCFAGTSTNFFIEQDGVKYGSYSGISVAEDGIVTARFDNGQTVPIFKIPLANFSNPNELQELSGNSYQQTKLSGNYVLNAPNTNGMGKIESGCLEASTTDLATEFVNIMILNRAYNANAKLLSVADGMLETVQNILR